MNKKISIRQTPGTKIQAYRLNSENDIPSFLEQYVTMDNKNIYLDFCKKTVAPLGSVIICIYLEPTLYECSLYETLPPHVFEKDGIFYKESPILQAQKKVGNELPDFMEKATIDYYEDFFILTTCFGVSPIKPDTEGYYVLHGFKNGLPLVDFIYDNEYSDYVICDQNGKSIGPLT